MCDVGTRLEVLLLHKDDYCTSAKITLGKVWFPGQSIVLGQAAAPHILRVLQGSRLRPAYPLGTCLL